MAVNHLVPGSSPGPGANMECTMQNGKGDRTRRSSVTKRKYNKNWEKTFAKKKEDEDESMSNKTKRSESSDSSRD